VTDAGTFEAFPLVATFRKVAMVPPGINLAGTQLQGPVGGGVGVGGVGVGCAIAEAMPGSSISNSAVHSACFPWRKAIEKLPRLQGPVL
jgi:hypothetical protein